MLTLIVAAADARAPLATHGINLVDENNAGGILFGLAEQVAHPRRAHAHKHFDKFRTGDAEEGNGSLACDRLGQQRFTGTGLTNQQHPFGNAGSNGGKFLRALEEGDHLLQFFLGLFNASHIVKYDAGFGLHLKAGLRLAKAHGVARSRRRSPQQHEQPKNENQCQQRVSR